MTQLDYQSLRMQIELRGKGRPRKHPLPATTRDRERARRVSLARGRAWAALAEAFPDEFRLLHEAAKAEVDAEFGPLPEATTA